MKRRILISALAFLLVAVHAEGAGRKAFKSGGFTSAAGLNKGLTFHAMFDDPASPLKLIRGASAPGILRASPVTFVHPTTGLVTTADNNVAAIEDAGVRIQGKRTNLALNNFTDNWVSSDASMIQNLTGPDGVANSAWTVTDNSTNYEYYTQTITVPNDSSSWTYSAFIKKTTGTPSSYPGMTVGFEGGTAVYGHVTIDTTNGTLTNRSTGGPDSKSIISVNNYWKVSITIANNTLGNTSSIIRIFPAVNTDGSGTWSTATVGTVGFYGAQHENSSFPSSYIPTTTAAVTREADLLYIEQAGNISMTEGAVAATVRFNTNRANLLGGRIVGLSTGGDQPMSIDTDANPTFMNDGTGYAGFDLNTWAGEQTLNVLSWWSASLGKMGTTINGVNSAEADFDGSLAGDQILIGSAGADLAMGWINVKNLRIWDHAPTAPERTAITQ